MLLMIAAAMRELKIMRVRSNLVVVVKVKTSEMIVDQIMVEDSMIQQIKKYYCY